MGEAVMMVLVVAPRLAIALAANPDNRVLGLVGCGLGIRRGILDLLSVSVMWSRMTHVTARWRGVG